GLEIAVRRERLRQTLLLARDPAQVVGLRIDLTAVGESHVLLLVIAPADAEGHRALGLLALRHGELVGARLEREGKTDDRLPRVPDARDQYALAVERHLGGGSGRAADAHDRDAPGHLRPHGQIRPVGWRAEREAG